MKKYLFYLFLQVSCNDLFVYLFLSRIDIFMLGFNNFFHGIYSIFNSVFFVKLNAMTNFSSFFALI